MLASASAGRQEVSPAIDVAPPVQQQDASRTKRLPHLDGLRFFAQVHSREMGFACALLAYARVDLDAAS
jgi:hypothetical protein